MDPERKSKRPPLIESGADGSSHFHRAAGAWPWLVVVGTLAVTAWALRQQGRLWRCASCERLLLWSGDAWGPETSQHLFDPYSLTHLLHGFLFCGLLALVAARLVPSSSWRLSLAIAAEALWEVVENSETVIERYRQATAALGYHGDTILNSLGDIFACGLGFLFARWLGRRRALIVFVAVELLLLLWIRDNLTLNILMLLYPLEAIRDWQTGH